MSLEMQAKLLRISEAAVARLQAHAWPGNVREPRNVMKRAAALVRGAVDVADLAFPDQGPVLPPVGEFDLALLSGELGVAVEALELTMVRRACRPALAIAPRPRAGSGYIGSCSTRS
jgi:DNA-binding NtrC family response regulator